MVRTTKKRKRGGTRKAGKLKKMLYLDESPVIGAGGYGIVLKDKNQVVKLFIDTESCNELKLETQIHQDIYKLVIKYTPYIHVPKIDFIQSEPIEYKDKKYLCGIGMEYLEPPLDFKEQVHCCLGYQHDDIDSSWGQRMGLPISETNPTRGFFASPETLEYIWNQEMSNMTIDILAFQMGTCLRMILDNGILPIDIEFVWSGGKLCMIDFGLCEYGHINAEHFLKKHGLRGLADDFYIPHEGQRGYGAFIKGYMKFDDTYLL
jgi:hypothetical protein